MSIEKLLKTTNARISLGDKWLVWDETYKEWAVYGRKFAQRNTRVIERTEYEATAIAALRKDW